MTTIKHLLMYCVGVALLGAALWFTALNSPDNLTEEGLFEVGQIVATAVGVILWLARGPAQTSINIFVATVGLLVLGRETSWAEAYGGSDALVEALKYGHGAILIVTLIALALYWLRRDTRRAQLFRTGFRSSYMAWLALGCALILLGDVFEKEVLDSDSDLFWEEWLELAGVVSFLVPPLLRRRA